MPKGEQPSWIGADSLWERIEPLLPKVERRKHHPGRRRLDDRKVLCGILFVLHTGVRWEFLQGCRRRFLTAAGSLTRARGRGGRPISRLPQSADRARRGT
ncbi:transposase [Actinomadura luteofluorescens]|uniref:transposase n=1 Tax=Actinomadura luteofluorescens TaxID=46163 RepID=UPI0015CA61C1